MDSAKPWYQSKTIWANLSALLAWIATMAIDGATNGQLPDELAPYAVLIALAGNLLLRVVTKQPLDFSAFFAPKIMLVAVILAAHSGYAGEAMIVGPAAVPAPGYPCKLFVQGEIPEGTTIGWDVSPRLEGVQQVRAAADGRSADLTTLAGPKETQGRWRLSVAIHEPDREIYFRYADVFVPGVPYVPTPPPGPPQPAPAPDPEPDPKPVPPAPNPQPTPVPPPQPLPDPLLPVPVELSDVRGEVLTAARAIQSPTRAADIEKLISLCRELQSDATRADPVTDPQHYINRLGNTISGLGSSWKSFLSGVGQALQQHYLAGHLKTVDRWAVLMQEARLGLEAAQ